MFQQYLIPYLISNAVALTLLFLAFVRPQGARWGIAVIFGYAAMYNAYIGLLRSEEYQGFAELAVLDFYRDFIRGFFRDHATPILLFIAVGQGVISLTLALGGRFLWIGVFGTCLFLTAIIPLWIGSAFPFSVIVSAAAIVMLKRVPRSEPRT